MTAPIEKLPGNERVTVPGFLLDRRRGDHYVLRVVGDSMADEHLLDGDYAVIRRGDDWQPGEACVVVVGDEATIKRVWPGDRAGTLTLTPLGLLAGDGDGVTYTRASVEIQGVVVGIMRKF